MASIANCLKFRKKEDKKRIDDLFTAYATLSSEEHRLRNLQNTNTTIENHNSETLKDEIFRCKKEESKKYLMKKYNFDASGRFKGGYPNRYFKYRGTSVGITGSFHCMELLRTLEEADTKSDFKVYRQDVVEYGRYMKDDKEKYRQKMTYITGKIEEDYFSTTQFSFVFKTIAFFSGLFLVSQIWREYYEKNQLRKKKWIEIPNLIE